MQALRNRRRRPGRALRRALHDSTLAGRRSRGPRTRAPPPISSTAISNGRAAAGEGAAGHGRRGGSSSRAGSARSPCSSAPSASASGWQPRAIGGNEKKATTTVDAQPLADRLPGGIHPDADGRADHRRGQDRPRRSGTSTRGCPQRAYLRADEAASRCRGIRPRRRERRALEGFLFPAIYDFSAKTTSQQLVARAARGLPAQLGEVDLSYAQVEEPDAVRRPDHRLDDREGGDRPGGAAARRGRHLQPAARRACRSGSTRRSATGCDVPADEVAHAVAAQQRRTRTTRANARACRRRRSRTRASRRCRPPRIRRRSTTSTSSQAGQDPPLLHGERRRVRRLHSRARLRRVIAGETRLVGLLGDPVARLAVAADAERRLRRTRARLGLRAARRRARTRSSEAVRGLVGARLRRRERDDAAQAGGRGGSCDERRRRLRQHARRRATAASSGRAPTPRRCAGSTRERAGVIGGGGALRTRRSRRGAARTRASSPAAATGRRRSTDADLVVNATPVRDELLFQPRRADAGRPRLPRTAADRARRPRARRARPWSTGSRCSSARAPRRSSAGRACPRRRRHARGDRP